jgi:hypothetical protein
LFAATRISPLSNATNRRGIASSKNKIIEKEFHPCSMLLLVVDWYCAIEKDSFKCNAKKKSFWVRTHPASRITLLSNATGAWLA